VSGGTPAHEVSAKCIYEGRIVTLYEREVRLPNGHTARLEIVHHPGAAAVVPLHEDGTVTMVHQYRHAAGGWLYEVPAGLLEAGESPEDCAARELAEETGLAAASLTPLITYRTTPGFSDEVIHLFLASGLTQGESDLGDDEVLEVVRVPLGQALDQIGRGEITDGKTIIGLLAAERAGGAGAGS
jgi:ADP-ribose diphosphatase